ncbi:MULTISPECIES: hypothetical protein [unclassified Novosphingobium]|uniref:hypothetical protein n=1 Tax=unclassified Novosphingobium TaxID=2644732 RepID=UPI0025DD2CA1|nr:MULTISPECIES: hypothetical protein [unclassified Novosphingobium]HQV04799.1 hypothetical protein [Novosphingobium sp.]
MMSESFYIQQAESCQRAADDTPLANQRDTLLRSRAAWLTLAAREQAIRAARAQREREKEQADER